MTQTTIDMKARTPSGDLERNCVRRLPYTIEHVVTPEGGYDFEWSGSSAYVALHDILLNEGTMAGDIAPTSLLDMRHRMTFLPRGVRVSGWGEPARHGTHSPRSISIRTGCSTNWKWRQKTATSNPRSIFRTSTCCTA